VICDISMSLDGFIAGPNPTLEQPLGEGGEGLHEWAIGQASWRERHGRDGGEAGPDDEVMKESLAAQGAVVMGRRMFSGGAGPGKTTLMRTAGGETSLLSASRCSSSHHAREPVTKQGGTTFTFVTDGIEPALEQARAAAGDRDVLVAGGADAVQQYLRAELFDELQIHLVPVLLGGGVRLLDNLGDARVGLELDRVVDSPAVTHLRYRVLRP
jgi:dihydrofolate reductase